MNSREIRDALRQLVNDLDVMHVALRFDEGDPAAHEAERGDYFGEFSKYYDPSDMTMVDNPAGIRVCWPSLRASLERAKKALGHT